MKLVIAGFSVLLLMGCAKTGTKTEGREGSSRLHFSQLNSNSNIVEIFKSLGIKQRRCAAVMPMIHPQPPGGIPDCKGGDSELDDLTTSNYGCVCFDVCLYDGGIPMGVPGSVPGSASSVATLAQIQNIAKLNDTSGSHTVDGYFGACLDQRIPPPICIDEADTDPSGESCISDGVVEGYPGQ